MVNSVLQKKGRDQERKGHALTMKKLRVLVIHKKMEPEANGNITFLINLRAI